MERIKDLNHPGGYGDKENGKGVGDMPGKGDWHYMDNARENTDFEKKEGEVQRVVGD